MRSSEQSRSFPADAFIRLTTAVAVGTHGRSKVRTPPNVDTRSAAHASMKWWLRKRNLHGRSFNQNPSAASGVLFRFRRNKDVLALGAEARRRMPALWLHDHGLRAPAFGAGLTVFRFLGRHRPLTVSHYCQHQFNNREFIGVQFSSTVQLRFFIRRRT